MKFSFKPNINNKIIILSSTFGIIIIAIITFVILPLYTNINQLNDDLYDSRVQLAIYEKQRLNSDETRKEYNDIKSDIDNITSVLVKDDDILKFIDSLDTLAINTNVKQKISLLNLDQSITSGELLIDISATGNWDQINSYLYTLENLKYYLVIDNISFIRINDNISTNFNLAVYLE